MDCFSVFEDEVCIFKATPSANCIIGLALTLLGNSYLLSYQIGASWEDANGISHSKSWLKKILSLQSALSVRIEDRNERIWPDGEPSIALSDSELVPQDKLLAKVKIGSEKEKIFTIDFPSHLAVSFGETTNFKSSFEYHLSFFGRKPGQENLIYLIDEDLTRGEQIEIKCQRVSV